MPIPSCLLGASTGNDVKVSRYFRRPWEESRGDEYDSWGTAVYLFEVSDDGYPSRQIEVYENGRTLRYGPDHLEDEFGMLTDQPLDFLDFASFEVDAAEFEDAWDAGR